MRSRKLAGLPATFMLGAMIAAIFVGIGGGTIRVHHGFQDVAIVVIGCMIARSLTPASLGTVVTQWPLCLAVVTSTVLVFTRPILTHATRALPQTLLSIVALIAFCGGVAAVLVMALGVDPLTAYLATSPGGLDSAAVIAASSHADLSFITALQTIRIVMVVLIGPSISRVIARRVERTGDHPPGDGGGEEPVSVGPSESA